MPPEARYSVIACLLMLYSLCPIKAQTHQIISQSKLPEHQKPASAYMLQDTAGQWHWFMFTTDSAQNNYYHTADTTIGPIKSDQLACRFSRKAQGHYLSYTEDSILTIKRYSGFWRVPLSDGIKQSDINLHYEDAGGLMIIKHQDAFRAYTSTNDTIKFSPFTMGIRTVSIQEQIFAFIHFDLRHEYLWLNGHSLGPFHRIMDYGIIDKNNCYIYYRKEDFSEGLLLPQKRIEQAGTIIDYVIRANERFAIIWDLDSGQYLQTHDSIRGPYQAVGHLDLDDRNNLIYSYMENNKRYYCYNNKWWQDSSIADNTQFKVLSAKTQKPLPSWIWKNNNQYFIKFNKQKYGPLQQVFAIGQTPDKQTYAAWKETDNQHYILINDSLYGPHQRIIPYSNNQQFMYLYRQNKQDFLQLPDTCLGPFDAVFSFRFREDGSYHYTYKSENQYFIRFGKEAFGPFTLLANKQYFPVSNKHKIADELSLFFCIAENDNYYLLFDHKNNKHLKLKSTENGLIINDKSYNTGFAADMFYDINKQELLWLSILNKEVLLNALKLK